MSQPEEPAISVDASPAQRAYDHVLSKVTSGELPSGTRLVTRSIAKEIGTSLNPVREAIGRLAAKGVIKHIPGAGAFVRALDRRELSELYGMREAVETHAAEEAARLISEPELEELQAICDDWHRIAKSIQARGQATDEESGRWFDHTVRFHRVLVDAARNRFLSKALAEYRLVSAIFDEHRRHHTVQTLAAAAITWRRHAALVRALRAGDSDRSSELVRTLIRTGRRNTLAAFYERRFQ
jgi:DNA-binding GntR family transcriptional regulator